MDELKGNLLLITTAISTIVVSIKILKTFFMELVKIKYNVTLGIKSTVKMVIRWSMAILFFDELLIIALAFYDAIINKGDSKYIKQFAESSMNFNIAILIAILISIILLAPLFIIVSSWGKIFNKFIEKFEEGRCKEFDYDKINKWLYGGRACSIIISALVIFTFFMFGPEYIVNNKEILFIGFMSIIEYILLNSLNEMGKVIVERKVYILYTNQEKIYCSIYLEYKEYYLVIEEGIERYIKISEVKEIRNRTF